MRDSFRLFAAAVATVALTAGGARAQAFGDAGVTVLIVSDEEKEVESQVVEDLHRYKEMGTSFGYKPVDLTCIVDNVHWVKSHNSRLMQLADLCAYVCQRQARDRGKTSAAALAVMRLWESVCPRIWSGRVWPGG
ncbi:MAG TPA: DUF3800 domain-containing protein [Longimicrobium sp.]|nr:DUF3800 domain-containing protein [Longimicrobium sp.]